MHIRKRKVKAQWVSDYPTWEIFVGCTMIGRMFLWGNPQRPQMAYMIDQDYCNQGYMTEALKRVLRVYKRPFELHIHHTNLASRRVAEKCGFIVCESTPYYLIYRLGYS